MDECDGSTSTFRAPAGYTNGHTLDREGRLVSCEHLARRVTRTEHDGTITVLADRYQGKRLNSPNDVVVRSDGSIWFTDPSYGIDHDYEGLRQERELDGCHVYRIDPDGALTVVADDFIRPNGLAFSLDETQLYVVDTPGKHIRRFDLDGEKLTGGEVFTPCTAGIGPSSTTRLRNARCSASSFGGTPGEGLLMRPSGPCALNRITQSRSV